jgi:hypothetical protein
VSRVNDKRVAPDTGERERFASAILPSWDRQNAEDHRGAARLYLHGLSSRIRAGAGPGSRQQPWSVQLGVKAFELRKAPSSSKPQPRSPTMPTGCWCSTTTQLSTDGFCARRIRSNRRSRPFDTTAR